MPFTVDIASKQLYKVCIDSEWIFKLFNTMDFLLDILTYAQRLMVQNTPHANVPLEMALVVLCSFI